MLIFSVNLSGFIFCPQWTRNCKSDPELPKEQESTVAVLLTQDTYLLKNWQWPFTDQLKNYQWPLNIKETPRSKDLPLSVWMYADCTTACYPKLMIMLTAQPVNKGVANWQTIGESSSNHTPVTGYNDSRGVLAKRDMSQ